MTKRQISSNAERSAAASGRYSGIQFARGDLAGRKLGRAVAELAWAKAQSYFGGKSVRPDLHSNAELP